MAQLVTTRTHTDGHPTSTSLPLSPTEVDQPVKSIAEYMLAREKMMWKNAYEYDTGFLCSFSSFSSAFPSSGSRGFSAHFQPSKYKQTMLKLQTSKPKQETEFGRMILCGNIPARGESGGESSVVEEPARTAE